MSNYKIEDYLTLCALSYFDIEKYQKGMNIVDFIHSCMNTDNLSVFFKKTLDFLKKQDFSVFINLKIEDYFNDNQKSGVVCYSFEDEEDCFIVFRGSELHDPILCENGWKDWFDNLEIFLGVTFQQLKAYECFKKIHTNKKIHLLGHSKGGNLALFIGMVCNEDRFSQISEMITFNAPQFDLDKYNLYEDRINNNQFIQKIISIENEKDPVSSLFDSIKQPLFVLSNYQGKQMIDIYESHQIWGFKKEKDLFAYCESKRQVPYFIDLINHMNDEQKKWLIHRCLQLSNNKKILKRIQERIEGWVNENETHK